MATFPTLSYTCPIPWENLRGDERERFCAKCQRTVVNLSLLTEPQRRALLASARPGELCVAYYRRLSGDFVTAEAPLTRKESRAAVQFGVTALSAAALAVVASHAPTLGQATEAAREAATTSYVSVREETMRQAKDAIGRIAVYLGAEPEPPVVMVMGMIVCPSPPPSAAAPSVVDPAVGMPSDASLRGEAPPQPAPGSS